MFMCNDGGFLNVSRVETPNYVIIIYHVNTHAIRIQDSHIVRVAEMNKDKYNKIAKTSSYLLYYCILCTSSSRQRSHTELKHTHQRYTPTKRKKKC